MDQWLGREPYRTCDWLFVCVYTIDAAAYKTLGVGASSIFVCLLWFPSCGVCVSDIDCFYLFKISGKSDERRRLDTSGRDHNCHRQVQSLSDREKLL